MDTSDQGLTNDDGMQAPLLANEERNEDLYQVESPSSQTRKNTCLIL